MNIPPKRDSVFLYVVRLHISERIIGAVPAVLIKIGEVFKLRRMPVDAISAKDQTAHAGGRLLDGMQPCRMQPCENCVC